MIKILVAIITLLFFNACEEKSKITPSGKSVKIGILAPTTGKNKRFGHQSLLGLKASNTMKKYLNNGDEIIFEVLDTKDDVLSAKEALSVLLRSDVKVIFSFMNSTQMLAMKETIHNSKIPMIVTLATDSNLVKNDGYISQVCIDNHTQVLVSSHYIKDEKFIENIGIVYDSRNYYSAILADEFKNYFTSIDGKIEFFMDISSDIGISEFKKFDKSETRLIFNTSDSLLTRDILKIIDKENSNLQVLGTDGLFSGALDLSKKDLNLFNGVYVVEHYAHAKHKSENRKTLESILDKDGVEQSSFAFLAYEGYQLLISTLENCPRYNTQCINSLLQNSDVIEGVSDNFSMTDAKVNRAVYIDIIKNATLKKEVIIH